MKALGINSWYRTFEPKLVEDAAGRVSIPLKQGTGRMRLARLPGGAAAYGVFVSLLTVAINAVPRGTLVFSDKDGTRAHDAESLHLVTGFDAETIQKSIDLLLEVGWLEWVEFEIKDTPVAALPQRTLEEHLKELRAVLTHNGTSLLPEWDAAVKGLKPSKVREIFRRAVPGIRFPSDFKRKREEMGL